MITRSLLRSAVFSRRRERQRPDAIMAEHTERADNFELSQNQHAALRVERSTTQLLSRMRHVVG